MRKAIPVLASTALIVLLVTVSIAGAAPGQTPNGPTAPDKLIAGNKPGAYYLDYGFTTLSPSSYPVNGAIRFFSWSDLQTAPDSYNWAPLDFWLNQRAAAGLSAGIFISPYDGEYNGDIRALPNFVIQTHDAVVVLPYPYNPSTPEYINYYQRGDNGNFESEPHTDTWTLTGDAAIVTGAPGGGWVGRLGGKNNAADAVTHDGMRIPAMPSGADWPGGSKMELTFSSYVSTTNSLANADHLYVELLDANNAVITQVAEVTNTSGAKGVWVDQGAFDLSDYTGRFVKIRFRATTGASNPTTFYVDDVALRVRHVVPRYWSNTYLNLYQKFITALGNKLRSDSRVDFVSIGTGLHGETQPVDVFRRNQVLQQYMLNAGLTSQGWVATVNKITDMYVAAFSIGTSLRKNLVLQYAPYFQYVSERKQFTDYAVLQHVGLSSNNLMPELDGALTDNGTGGWDPVINRSAFVPIAFETYANFLCSPVFAYWAMYNGLDKHADYLRFDPELLTGPMGSKNMAIFSWAKNYYGKTAADTPSAWTVMREHRNPTPYCFSANEPSYTSPGSPSSWPQLGNFNFYLYQDDRIPGGQTVPETNDKGADSTYAVNPVNGSPYSAAGLGNCPTSNAYASFYPANYPCNQHPYNPNLPPLAGQSETNYYSPYSWTGGGQEAWVVRRTDQGTGNPYMWFVIDSDYIDGSEVYSVKITVKYFDIGADTWSLRYDATNNDPNGKLAGTVTKGDTKQLMTKVFTITDGKFAKRLAGGGADFVIDSRAVNGANDGNEWIHMVDVSKTGSQPEPSPTPTATQTRTVTPTPTVTPTSTPTTGIVRGIAYFDKNNNGQQDAGEPGLPGAVIALRQGATERYTATAGANGSFMFPAVNPGQYMLAEKTPPAGYLLSSFTLNFAVAANNNLQFDVPHLQAPTATPTLTPTRTSTPTVTGTATRTATPTRDRTYLPMLLKRSNGN